MEKAIVSNLDNLSYVTQQSFGRLSNSIEGQLTSINSSIKFNTLITGIGAYEAYKINSTINKSLKDISNTRNIRSINDLN